MFGLVTRFFFNNGQCTSIIGRNGTCYTTEECSQRNGVAEGECANGLGVCCIFQITTCGGNVIENCTTVRGTRFNGQVCEFNLEECSSNICFFRLDFDSLTLGSTLASNGDCSSDTISFSSPSVPLLCGSLSGQHIYLPASIVTDDSFSLNFGLSTASPLANAYQIQVKQIPCGQSFTPPFGCNQFFFGQLTGQFESYNYMMGTGYHLNNQNYDICIRTEEGICSIAYVAFPGIQGFAFGPDSFLGKMESVNGVKECTADYVLVPNSANAFQTLCSVSGPGFVLTPTITRYCGYYLACDAGSMTNLPIIANNTDFRVTVVTDDFDSTTNMMVGLQFAYQQLPCSGASNAFFLTIAAG
eukprot:TCALIF_06195-PA protein Name:"Protein of unknown function" AED:0.07 eAED:0.07 QI:54/1/0.8/1/0.25/0.2/5/152/356